MDNSSSSGGGGGRDGGGGGGGGSPRMQGIYTYIPDTNRVSRVNNISAIMRLHFVVRLCYFLF